MSRSSNTCLEIKKQMKSERSYAADTHDGRKAKRNVEQLLAIICEQTFPHDTHRLSLRRAISRRFAADCERKIAYPTRVNSIARAFPPGNSRGEVNELEYTTQN